MSIQISVIVPTYNRVKELDELLESLINQDISNDNFEIIIIDQNDLIDLNHIISKYESKINIRHIKTLIKGISHAKNIGIEKSKAEIITFADDDAKYYPNTLSNAINHFEKYTEIDIFYGRVFDRINKKNLIRKWKQKTLKLHIFNFSLNYCAITCFTKRKDLRFDEEFGVGSNFMMGEEFDYIIRAIIENKFKVLYTPDIEVWHPDHGVFVFDVNKVFKYAIGYGAVCRKNLNASIVIILLISLSYQIIMALYHLLFLDFNKTKHRWIAFKGRVKGFLEFKTHEKPSLNL